jgi:hypothetical protein
MVSLVQTWYAKPNPAVCDQLTDNFLQTGWGKPGEAGRATCRSDVAKAKPVQAVTVQAPTVTGDKATVKVSYTLKGERRADDFGFVRVGGQWLADSVTGGARPSTTSPATTAAGTTPKPPATTKEPPATTAPETNPSSVGTPAQFLATMKPVGSDESGTAVLRGTSDGKTFAALLMKHAPAGRAQAAEIVRGACAAPGPVAFSLQRVDAGISGTTLPVLLGSFHKGRFAVVVLSRGAGSRPVACGDVHRG